MLNHIFKYVFCFILCHDLFTFFSCFFSLLMVMFLTNLFLTLVWIAGDYFNSGDRVSPGLVGSRVFHQLERRCFVSKRHTRGVQLRCVSARAHTHTHTASNRPAGMVQGPLVVLWWPLFLFLLFLLLFTHSFALCYLLNSPLKSADLSFLVRIGKTLFAVEMWPNSVVLIVLSFFSAE